MIDFDKLPKPTTSEAINFWNRKLSEHKGSAEFLALSSECENYLEVIPFIESALDALITLDLIKKANDQLNKR